MMPSQALLVGMDFTVSNLNDSGVGSLRWAIGEANQRSGFDQILVDSSLSGGTISLSSNLEIIRDAVAIQGLLSESGLAAIAIDFNGHQGLIFKGKTAAGSSLNGFALGNASGDGIVLDASRVTIQNNLIGVALDGTTARGNEGHGITITNRSNNNLIGTLDPLTGVPLDQQRSNVISANGGSGINIEGGDHNRIANNRIGTSADGSADLGNDGHGIRLWNGADHNRIGGAAHAGNDPTQGTFQRPGQGNLISGNTLNGVLISDGSHNNRLLGNFIGTDAEGNSALGNGGDGVAIIKANHNGLIGTTRNQSPFIYYNVVSGNGGNGLRVRDSDAITIHANFFGLGADNATIVANQGDGALIEGTSRKIQYGGVIPLGNVNAGNEGNGINVTDHVRNFITFNTFAGLTAFGGIAPNQQSGIRISSDGGNNRVRTNVMAGNAQHGLHITGHAHDIWVDPNIIGLNTYGTEATYSDGERTISWGNNQDGIRVDGNANDILIAGNRRSVIPQNTVSNNDGFGLAIDGKARNITVDETYVGLSSLGFTEFGNKQGGINVGPGTRKISIGQAENQTNGNRISGNNGNGISLSNPVNAKLFNNRLNNNTGSGIVFNGGINNTLIGNRADTNQEYGFAISTAKQTTAARDRGQGNGKGLYG